MCVCVRRARVCMYGGFIYLINLIVQFSQKISDIGLLSSKDLEFSILCCKKKVTLTNGNG